MRLSKTRAKVWRNLCYNQISVIAQAVAANDYMLAVAPQPSQYLNPTETLSQ